MGHFSANGLLSSRFFHRSIGSDDHQLFSAFIFLDKQIFHPVKNTGFTFDSSCVINEKPPRF